MTNDKLEKMLSEMSHVWKTESAYYTWLRGSIRRAMWSKNPVKLEFIKQNRIKIPNPNPKGKVKEVWGGVCALTGNIFPIGDMEVDHKEGNHSLKTLDDLVPFVKGIVMITLDDLQLVSKEAHKIKSYAEKQGISFEEAKIEKEVIELIKQKKDKEYCIEQNLVVESNQALRRKVIVAHKLSLLKENEMDRPLIVKSDKLKEGLSFDLSHEDVVEQLLPMFEKEIYVVLPDDLIEGEKD